MGLLVEILYQVLLGYLSWSRKPRSFLWQARSLLIIL